MANATQTYGIVLPITHGPHGYFNQSRSVLEQVSTNIKMLLRTKKGERRMNPDFGSGMWSILFEQNTDNIKIIIENTIRKDIGRWMPYVNVESVNVDNTSDSTQHRINVSVTFTVPSSGVFEQQTLQVAMNTTNV
jgi:phage baseplate assembly protein W